MHELRVDPLTGRRVIIAPDPQALAAGVAPELPAPGPVPALSADAPEPPAEAERDLFWSAPARGVEERIPGPGTRLGEQDPAQLAATVEGWRERMRAHPDAACLHLTVDEGSATGDGGGARLYVMDFVPADIARERERFGAYATRTMGANLLADLLQREVRRRERIVAIDREAVLICPWAAPAPYVMTLIPRSPRMRFQDDGPTGAALLGDGLRRLRAVLGAAMPLTLWVRTAPSGSEHFCWRIEIVPRLRAPTGIELGAGIAVNPLAPEVAARALREAAD